MFFVSLIKEFRNRLQRKLQDNLLEVEEKKKNSKAGKLWIYLINCYEDKEEKEEEKNCITFWVQVQGSWDV